MADSTGSAREEAERLVAAVLARASEQDLSRTRQRVTEGIGALSGSLAGLPAEVSLQRYNWYVGDVQPDGWVTFVSTPRSS